MFLIMLINLFRFHFGFILLISLQMQFLTFSHSIFSALSLSFVIIKRLYYFSKCYLIAYFLIVNPFNLSFLFLSKLWRISLHRYCLNSLDFYPLTFIGSIILFICLRLEFILTYWKNLIFPFHFFAIELLPFIEMIYLQLFLDVLTFFYAILKNTNRYYNSTESFSFTIDFKNHFDFIFQ